MGTLGDLGKQEAHTGMETQALNPSASQGGWQVVGRHLPSSPTHPDLQLDPLVIAVDGFDLEVYANSADKGWSEGVICVAEEERGFAHAAVPNDQDLEHIVEVLV